MSVRARVILLTLVFVGLVAVGCTKRKNRFLFTSETSTTPGDLAPKVGAVSPDRSENGVRPGTEISATFDRAIDPSTVDGSSARLEGPEGLVPASIELLDVPAGEDRRLVLRPARALLMRAEYRVTLTTDIQTPDGHALLDEVVWTFRTRDGLFDAEEEVGLGVGQEQDPRVQVDDRGHGFVMWHSAENGRQRLFVKRRQLEGNWNGPITLDDVDGGNLAGYRLAVNPEGRAIAIWYRTRVGDGGQPTLVRRYVPGAGWSEAEAVATDEAAFTFPETVTLDDGGNALVLYRLLEGDDDNVWARRWSAATETWTPPALVRRGGSFFSGVATNGAGATVVAWKLSNGQSVQANRFEPGSGWSGAQTISTSTGQVDGRPQVVIDRSGTAIVTWEQAEFSDGPSSIYASVQEAGGEWQGGNPIEGQPNQATGHRLASNDAGQALVVWQQDRDDELGGIASSEYVPGSGWRRDGVVIVDDFGVLTAPSVTLDDAGDVVVAFLRRGDTEIADVCVSRRISGTWGVAQAVEHLYENAHDPIAVTDGQGSALVFWSQRRGPQLNLYSARGLKGLGWLPAEELGSNIQFGPAVARDASGRVLAAWQAQDDIEAPIRVRGSAFH